MNLNQNINIENLDLDLNLDELDIKSVNFNPKLDISRSSNSPIALSSENYVHPNLSISTNSLDSNSLDFGLDLITNKKKIRQNDNNMPNNLYSNRPQSPNTNKPITVNYTKPPQDHIIDFSTIDLEKELSSINLDEIQKMSGPSIPDFNNNINTPLSFDTTPSVPSHISYEQIQSQKFDYLCKLDRLQKNGIKPSRIFSMSSDLDEIKMEYEKIMYERRLKNSIKMQRQMLITCCSGIEFLNGKFDPFGAQLDDWSSSMNDDIESYDDVFTELYEKYQGNGSMAPEIKLLFMVSGSAIAYHVTQSMATKIPNAENIMRNNPNLRRQFEEAAMQEMSKETPGLAKFASMTSNLGNKNNSNKPSQNHDNINVDDIDSMINDISNSL